MKTSILLLTIAALILPTHAAEKNDKAKNHHKIAVLAVLKKRDANHDRQVTKEEFLAVAKNAERANRIFAKLDRNNDGVISIKDRRNK